jgi:hypothetical protein
LTIMQETGQYGKKTEPLSGLNKHIFIRKIN